MKFQFFVKTPLFHEIHHFHGIPVDFTNSSIWAPPVRHRPIPDPAEKGEEGGGGGEGVGGREREKQREKRKKEKEEREGEDRRKTRKKGEEPQLLSPQVGYVVFYAKHQ